MVGLGSAVMTPEIVEGKTHEDRVRELEEQEKHGPRKPTEEQRRYWLAHCERLRIIYAPFPMCRRIGAAGSAMTWAGTIVGDTFYDSYDKRGGGLYVGDKTPHWRETGDGFEWDDYAALCGVT